MGKKENLIGQKFNRLTVISEYEYNEKGKPRKWKCLCDCGNEKIVAGADLKRGHTKSCGCYQKEQISKATLKDLTGQRFGYLEVLERDLNYQGKKVKSHWFCLCHNCGSITSISADSLNVKKIISCGCVKSKGEFKIASLLSENNISFIKEFSFDDFKNRRYDFALLNKENKVVRLIEFDGIQHYYRPRANHWAATMSLEEQQKRDKEKNNIAKEKGIEIIRIPYWHLDNLTIIDLLDNKFLVQE